MNFFTLTARLFGLYQSWQGKSLSPATVIRKLNQTIPFGECSVSVQKKNNLGGFRVEGSYSPEQDRENLKSIKVYILMNSRRKRFKFDSSDVTEEKWFDLVADIASILGHEYVHLNQHRRRGWRRCKNYVCYDNDEMSMVKSYLGKSDEVDAYAFTMATEMAVDIPDYATTAEKTTTYTLYKTVFGAKDKTTLRLVSLSNKYFKRLEKQYNETIRTYI